MKKYISDCQGSFTLEATIVFPVFLALMILLINFINAAMVYIAVDHAVSETAKQIATRAYPLKYLKLMTKQNNPQKFTEVMTNLNLISAEAGSQSNYAVASDVVTMLGSKLAGEATDNAVSLIIKELAKQKIKALYPLGNIAGRDLTITQIKMYNPGKSPKEPETANNLPSHSKDISLTVEYQIKLAIPFFQLEKICLSNTAVENAWVE